MCNTNRSRREVLRIGIACGASLLAPQPSESHSTSSRPGAPVISEFPALAQTINNRELIYFDTAATAQRPRHVIDAVSDYYRSENDNPAPNLHSLSRRLSEIYERARAT